MDKNESLGSENLLCELFDLLHTLPSSESILEIQKIRDSAIALRKKIKDSEHGLHTNNLIVEVKLRAERKIGLLLSSMRLRGGDRRSNGKHQRLKLKDFGISHDQSKRWQLEATVSEEEFCKYLQHAHENESEISSASLIRLARDLNRTEAKTVQANNKTITHFSNAKTDGLIKVVDELKQRYIFLSGVLSSEKIQSTPEMTQRSLIEIEELISCLEKMIPDTD